MIRLFGISMKKKCHLLVLLMVVVSPCLIAQDTKIHISSPKRSIYKYEPIFVNVKGIVPVTLFDDHKKHRDNFPNLMFLESTLPNLDILVNGKNADLKSFLYNRLYFGHTPARYIKLSNHETDRHLVNIDQAYFVLFINRYNGQFISSNPGNVKIQFKAKVGKNTVRSNALKIKVHDPKRKREQKALDIFERKQTLSVFSTYPTNALNSRAQKQGFENLVKVGGTYPDSTYGIIANYLVVSRNYAKLYEATRDLSINSDKYKKGGTYRKRYKKIQRGFSKIDREAYRKNLKRLPKPSRWHLTGVLYLINSYKGEVVKGNMKKDVFVNYLSSIREQYSDVISKKFINKKINLIERALNSENKSFKKKK